MGGIRGLDDVGARVEFGSEAVGGRATEDDGSSLVDSDGEGICCIFFSLVPLFNGLRLCRLRAFSVNADSVEIFGSVFFRLITVPKRRNPPPKPPFLGVGGSGAGELSV